MSTNRSDSEMAANSSPERKKRRHKKKSPWRRIKRKLKGFLWQEKIFYIVVACLLAIATAYMVLSFIFDLERE